MTDYGSDRYGYVEVSAPSGIRPLGAWWDGLCDIPCADCNANLFVKHLGGDPWSPASWKLTVAHDDTCPFMVRHEETKPK